MKKILNKMNNSVVLLFGSICVLAVLLVVTTQIKANNKINLSEGESTIYTSAREYTPETIVNLYVEPKQEEVVEPTNSEVTEPTNSVVEQAPIEPVQPEPVPRTEVYEGMTIEELTDKLNRSLNSTVAGYGNLFASYSLEKGVDPYLAVAIMLHETGCKWKCSSLVTSCNNVGGQKGSPSCGGSFKKFNTLEDGIRGYIDNLSNNYFALGLNTSETIAKKYTGHSGNEWITTVNKYVEEIRAN